MYYPTTETYAQVLPRAEALRVLRAAWTELCPPMVNGKAYITDAQLNIIWALLAAKYSDAHINFNSTSAFKMKLISLIGETAPKFFKDLAIQQKLATLSIDDDADMAFIARANSYIANHADHPSTSPDTDSLETLTYIDSQNTSASKRGNLEAMSYLSQLLRSNLYTEFAKAFRNLFIMIALPECNCGEEESTVQDVKEVTITQNGDTAIIPDLGYDTMSSAMVHVDVAGGGAVVQSQKTVTITSNGSVVSTPDAGYDAVAITKIHVNVPTNSIQDFKELSASEIGPVDIYPDEGYDGIAHTVVNVDIEGEEVSRTITSNGPVTITPSAGYELISSVQLDVQVPQTTRIQFGKSVTVTSNGTITVTPDSGYDALAGVSVTTNVPHRLQNIAEVNPSTSEQTYNFDTTHYDGYNNFVVKAVSRAIDSNIKATNIKSGVTILGVRGTYEGEGGGGPESLDWFEELEWTPSINVAGPYTIELEDHGSDANFLYIYCDKSTPTVNREFGGVLLSLAPSNYTFATDTWSGTLFYRQTTPYWQKISSTGSTGVTEVNRMDITVTPNIYSGSSCIWLAGNTYHILVGRMVDAI